MTPRVSIIILNWNGWKDTIECLESVYHISYPSFNVILVDNNSTDDSITKIKEYCQGDIQVESKFFKEPADKSWQLMEYSEEEIDEINEMDEMEDIEERISNRSTDDIDKESKEEKEIVKDEINHNNLSRQLILIKNRDNYGFTGGNNVGINYALKSLKSDYILLLNNDTVVKDDFLSSMVDLAESDENIGFVGPKTYFYHPYPEKKMLQITGGGGIDLQKGKTFQRAYHEEDVGQYQESVDLGYIGGSCVLVKRQVLEEIGLLDEKFFMYWEDTDWSYRGTKAGYRSVYQPESIIWHKHGASSKPCFELYYLSRNRIYFMKKNTSTSEYRSFLIHFFLKVFWLDIYYYLIHLRDTERFSCYLKGLKDGFKLKIDQ